MFLKPCKPQSHWSFETRVRREGIFSTLPSALSATHSLTQRPSPLPPSPEHPCVHLFLPPPGSFGSCSQAIVGKSRTTGSIYLTSVSSTIAKHHQRAAALIPTHVSSEEFTFKSKMRRNVELLNEQCCHLQGRRMHGLEVKICLLLYWHYT